jgi:hypothetical protein
MEEIKLSIISDEDKDEDIFISNISNKNNIFDIDEIKEEYKDWIKTLIIWMNQCTYRKVINEIEKRKERYKILGIFHLWKYKILKIKAIFKIILIKFKKYKQEIQKEIPPTITSIEFWFNQIYFILQELLTDFTPDTDDMIDLNSIKILKPIQSIIEIYLELINLLIKFYYLRPIHVAEICSYLSILNFFIPYISLLTDIKSIYFLQNLFLLKAKIFLQNRNYVESLEQQKIVINLCFKVFISITDLDKYLNILKPKKDEFSKNLYNIFLNYVLALYLRGITMEHLGDNQTAAQAYILCKLTYKKYLVEDNEQFGIFLNKLDNEARVNLDICNDVKITIKTRIESERKKGMKKRFKKSYLKYKASKYNNLQHSLINDNYYYRKIIKPRKIMKGIKDKNRVMQLEKFLSKIGENLYIHEENLNSNLVNRYTKAKYIISTITMIDNLLSKDFQHILMKMDNVEITRPKEEIKNMIDKTVLTKRVKLFNLNLEKKNKEKLLYNTYRNKCNILKQSKSSSEYKENLVGNPININKLKKIPIIRNNNKDEGFYTCSSKLFNQQNKKKKDHLSISQRMPNTNKYKNTILKDNVSNQTINVKEKNYRIKSAIDRVNKNKFLTSTYGQIIKYPVDRESFSKSQIMKKAYLDKYLDKEFVFQKQLLNSKINEVKNIDEIEIFDKRKVYESTERDFDMILNIQKSKYDTKFISNLLTMKHMKVNNEINKKKEKKSKMADLFVAQVQKDLSEGKYKKLKRRKGITEISIRNIIEQKNEDDMKKLSVECADLSFRRKKLENKRRRIILNSSKS